MNPTIPAWWTPAGRALWALSLLAVLASLWAVRYLAPVEAQMGVVQKIIYVHVPSAVATYLAFAITCGAGIAYLTTRQWYWDAVVGPIRFSLLESSLPGYSRTLGCGYLRRCPMFELVFAGALALLIWALMAKHPIIPYIFSAIQ